MKPQLNPDASYSGRPSEVRSPNRHSEAYPRGGGRWGRKITMEESQVKPINEMDSHLTRKTFVPL